MQKANNAKHTSKSPTEWMKKKRLNVPYITVCKYSIWSIA